MYGVCTHAHANTMSTPSCAHTSNPSPTMCVHVPAQYARGALHPSHHGILASFLANGGCDPDKFKAANAALGLPGLSLLEEAVLRVQLRHWPMVCAWICLRMWWGGVTVL